MNVRAFFLSFLVGLFVLFTGHGIAFARPAGAAIDQAGWTERKREVALPNGIRVAYVTLILSGGKDPLFPTEHHLSLVAAIPHAEARVFPEFGHNPIWDRPGEVGPALAAFLARPGLR